LCETYYNVRCTIWNDSYTRQERKKEKKGKGMKEKGNEGYYFSSK
jgi:hypothetical protein